MLKYRGIKDTLFLPLQLSKERNMKECYDTHRMCLCRVVSIIGAYPAMAALRLYSVDAVFRLIMLVVGWQRFLPQLIAMQLLSFSFSFSFSYYLFFFLPFSLFTTFLSISSPGIIKSLAFALTPYAALPPARLAQANHGSCASHALVVIRRKKGFWFSK